MGAPSARAAVTASSMRRINASPRVAAPIASASSLTCTLLAAIVVALFKGRADWARVPPIIWVHLLTITLAVALTPVMLLRRRGDGRHRVLGYVWVAAMLASSAVFACPPGVSGPDDWWGRALFS